MGGQPFLARLALGSQQRGAGVLTFQLRKIQLNVEFLAHLARRIDRGLQPGGESLLSRGCQPVDPPGRAGFLHLHGALDQTGLFQLFQQGIQLGLFQPPDLARAVRFPQALVDLVAVQRLTPQITQQGQFYVQRAGGHRGHRDTIRYSIVYYSINEYTTNKQ